MSSITSETPETSATGLKTENKEKNKHKNKKTKTADKADKADNTDNADNADKPKPHILKSSYFECASPEPSSFIEVGIDEAGRGPMFGRVYIGAVVLPKDSKQFDFSKMKDSKKFHSDKKIKEVAEYIKSHALAWSVTYAEHTDIDSKNIRRATIDCMHNAVNELMEKMNTSPDKLYLLVDGNDFIPMMKLCEESYIQIPHKCIESGDNTYASIAAASILAKVTRDEYIIQMCKENPELNTKYDLESNKGYGTKKHMDGIKLHGISQWHRKSFGLCKEFS
jgi:ribonuclease HII